MAIAIIKRDNVIARAEKLFPGNGIIGIIHDNRDKTVQEKRERTKAKLMIRIHFGSIFNPIH